MGSITSTCGGRRERIRRIGGRDTLATRPEARTLLIEITRTFEQLIDEITPDSLEDAGFSEAAPARSGPCRAGLSRARV